MKSGNNQGIFMRYLSHVLFIFIVTSIIVNVFPSVCGSTPLECSSISLFNNGFIIIDFSYYISLAVDLVRSIFA